VYLNYDDEWNPARVSLQGTRSPEEEEMRWLSLLSVSAIQQGVRKYTVASVGSDERTGRTASAVISGQDRFLGKPDPIALSISDAFDYRTLADRLIASVQIVPSNRTVASVNSGDGFRGCPWGKSGVIAGPTLQGQSGGVVEEMGLRTGDCKADTEGDHPERYKVCCAASAQALLC